MGYQVSGMITKLLQTRLENPKRYQLLRNIGFQGVSVIWGISYEEVNCIVSLFIMSAYNISLLVIP